MYENIWSSNVSSLLKVHGLLIFCSKIFKLLGVLDTTQFTIHFSLAVGGYARQVRTRADAVKGGHLVQIPRPGRDYCIRALLSLYVHLFSIYMFISF